MGPDNPWSPSWRPDASGTRLRTIRLARHGGLFAGLLYVPVAVVAILTTGVRVDLALVAIVVGSAGVALLGAGLAPAAIGSRVDAVVTGLAFALGAPVAAVMSMFITALIVGAVASVLDRPPVDFDPAGTILRAGVQAAIGVVPLVAIAAIAWVALVRRSAAAVAPALQASAGEVASDRDDEEPG
jgi:Zn-dependent protease with chaperone function